MLQKVLCSPRPAEKMLGYHLNRVNILVYLSPQVNSGQHMYVIHTINTLYIVICSKCSNHFYLNAAATLTFKPNSTMQPQLLRNNSLHGSFVSFHHTVGSPKSCTYHAEDFTGRVGIAHHFFRQHSTNCRSQKGTTYPEDGNPILATHGRNKPMENSGKMVSYLDGGHMRGKEL